jgi:hypothetical protein
MIAVCASAIQGSLNPVIGKDVKKEREMFLGELLHCRYLCSNFSSLIYAHRELLLGVYEFDYLAKDILKVRRTSVNSMMSLLSQKCGSIAFI